MTIPERVANNPKKHDSYARSMAQKTQAAPQRWVAVLHRHESEAARRTLDGFTRSSQGHTPKKEVVDKWLGVSPTQGSRPNPEVKMISGPVIQKQSMKSR